MCHLEMKISKPFSVSEIKLYIIPKFFVCFKTNDIFLSCRRIIRAQFQREVWRESRPFYKWQLQFNWKTNSLVRQCALLPLVYMDITRKPKRTMSTKRSFYLLQLTYISYSHPEYDLIVTLEKWFCKASAGVSRKRNDLPKYRNIVDLYISIT